MLRADKENLVAGVAQRLRESPIALCGDFRGLTVSQLTRLRSDLRSAGCRATVLKNTLFRSAVRASVEVTPSVEAFLGIVVGPSLLITSSTDPIAPAKIVSKYAKDFEHFQVKGAFFEGDFLDESRLTELSMMPGREELLAQLLRTMLAPATNIVRLVNEPGTMLARLVAARETQLSAG